MQSYLEADPKNSNDEYVSVLPLPWIMEQTYAISKWCLSRMKVNFVEEPETMFDDLREKSDQLSYYWDPGFGNKLLQI